MRILVLVFNARHHLLEPLVEILNGADPPEFSVARTVLSDDHESGFRSFPRTRRGDFDVAILCLSGEGRVRVGAVIGRLQEDFGIPIVLAMDSTECRNVSGLLNLGAADFFLSPLKAADVIPRLLRLHRHSVESHSPVAHLKQILGLEQFIGDSEVLLREIRKIPKIAQCDASTLIRGETGTGKEMVARAIHYLSPRSNQPFVPVNCGAIPSELIENELFGHEAGAFTGADSATAGILHEANGGSLFLDEIDSLPFASQVKLLRVLQEKEYRPLGSRKSRRVDVRIMAASNGCFEELIPAGKFRSDLFYRLNIISLALPPLRERKEDIPLLARHLVAKYAAEFSRPTRDLSDAALRKLFSYGWPGNVRELENVIAGAVVLSEGRVLQADALPLPLSASETGTLSFKALKAQAVAEFESNYIRRLLIENNGNITRAAMVAKKNRRAFWQLMHKHHIQPRSHASSTDTPGQLPARARTNLS